MCLTNAGSQLRFGSGLVELRVGELRYDLVGLTALQQGLRQQRRDGGAGLAVLQRPAKFLLGAHGVTDGQRRLAEQEPRLAVGGLLLHRVLQLDNRCCVITLRLVLTGRANQIG